MPFRLDLLRHGSALPSAEGGDAARSLSPAGRAEVERVRDLYVRNGWRPDALFVSPLRRAQETAAIVLGAFSGLEPRTLYELTPDREPGDVVTALEAAGVWSHVLLIGHQPLLGRLAAHLTGAREPGFPPGGLVRIAFAGGLAKSEGRLEAG